MQILKKIGLIGLLLIVTFSLSGATCKSQKAQDQQEITITMWHLFDNEEVFKPFIDAYHVAHPNVKINFVKKDPAEYEEESLDALAQGEGPDIWLIRNDWVYKDYKKVVEMPAGAMKNSDKDTRSNLDIYKETFPQVVLDDNTVDGKIYALPFYVDTLALYWNRDIFSQTSRELEKQGTTEDPTLFQNPPSTWDSVIKLDKYLTKKTSDNKIEKSGIALGTSYNVQDATDILAGLMLQNHTKMVSDDKKSATFNLPIKKETGEPVYAGTQALEFYTSFANSGKESYSWNSEMPNSLTAFIEGKTAMMVGYEYYTNTIKQKNPNLNYGTAPLPQIKGSSSAVDYASYWTETVTKNSKHPDIAWDFLISTFKTGLDSYLMATGRPSPLKPADVPDMGQRPLRMDPFRFQQATAQSWFKGKYPTKMDKVLSDLIDNVVIYNQPSQTAIDAAASQATLLLNH